MFKCAKCGNDSKPGEKVNRVVVKTRPKVYPTREVWNATLFEWITVDRGGVGEEIVQEVELCGECK